MQTMRIVVRRTMWWCAHSVYALKSALGGTDASETPTARLMAFGVDEVAKAAEGHRGVDQGDPLG